MNETKKTDIAMGIGLAVGVKFVTQNSWVGEFVAGGGRNFLNDNGQPSGFPRFGLLIGKRF